MVRTPRRLVQRIRPLLVVAAILFVPADAAAVAPIAPQGASRNVAADAQSALDQISGYEFGDSRAALSALRILVRSSLESPDQRAQIEERMIAFLGSGASFAGKQFVCEQLSIIGSSDAVPVLTGLLLDQETTDIALFALQRIPGPAVDAALRESLAAADSGVRVAIINTIGERRDRAAVDDLATLVYDPDPQAARSAVAALGKIADTDAATALDAARSRTSGELRGLVLDAYLKCADQLVSGGDAARAASIYRDVYDHEDATSIRAAALRGLVLVDEESAVATILSSLKRDNRSLQTVAAGLVRGLPETADLDPIIAELADFSPPTQVQLLAAFAEREEEAAYPAVLNGLQHYDEDVRVAAISALVTIGSEADIALLTHLAASGSSVADQEAARRALSFLPGASVDQAIIAQIPDVEPAVRAELVRALGERAARQATGLLLETAVDPEPAVRRESLRALAIVAGPELIDDLIRLLISEADGGTRNEAQRTVVLVSQKILEPSSRAGPLLAALPAVEAGEARSALLQALGTIGDPAALPAIRAELESADVASQRAAVVALSSWPDAGPAEDLHAVAASSRDQVIRILALRGYVTLLRSGGGRAVEQSIELFEGAMALATQTTEKTMVLAGLGELRGPQALGATTRYLEDASIKREAEAALTRILGRLRNADEERTQRMLDSGLRGSLERILELSDDPQLREWAAEVLARGRDRSDPASR